MGFIQVLQQRNLDYVVAEQQFRPIIPKNGLDFAKLVKRIQTENLRVYIDYDCDPDGYFSAKCLVDTFRCIGFTNYTLCRHTTKRHVLSEAYVMSVVHSNYDVVFILDSSSDDMNTIKLIADAGIICCVVDHHITSHKFSDFPDTAVVINPKIDARYSEIFYDCLSAGAITALLCAFTLQSEFTIKPPTDLYLFGAITLYSDIMNMSNAYNIAYISRFQNTQIINSPLIKLFWDDRYDHFDKSYISFKLVPRLNALFRTENFDMLFNLFFTPDQINLDQMKQQIETLYSDCKKYTQRLVESCKVTHFEDFILAIIGYDNDAFARNFTGLVANTIASEYDKPVMCLHQTTPVTWGGSVRDPFSRDLLSVFKSVCYAQGHESAFGIEVPANNIKMITSVLKGEMPSVSDSEGSVIMLDFDKHPEDMRADLRTMALFNEFGGQGLPIAMGALEIKRNFKIYRDEKKVTIYGNSERFLCFKKAVDYGDVMLVKPTLCGSTYTNMVNSVHLK